MDKKITVIGAGFVGATTARRIVEQDIADCVLFDIVEGMPQGKALDLMQSAPIEGFQAKITGTNDYKDTAKSDIVVITAGLPRKPGMSRDDLLAMNAKIIKDVVEGVTKHSPNCILIIVTNPLDVMTHLAYKISGFNKERVVGMAGVLDSARYRLFIAEALSAPPHTVQATVLGGHGDAMVPLPHYSTVNGIPITQLLPKETIEKINDRTRNGGAEIVKLMKTGSAYYAPSASVVDMVKSIVYDRGNILPCCAYLEGQYGINDVYCGVPVRLTARGAEKIVDLELTDEELELLRKSSEGVKANVEKLNIEKIKQN